MTEFWNLFLDKSYQLSPWPWPEIQWDAVTESHVTQLPHTCEDFLRYCPDDGTAGMAQVPAELPREWPECRSAMAIYHDDESVYVFLNAFRPGNPIPNLADNLSEDFGCYFAMDGEHRGLYFGLNQNNEPICLAKVWDRDLQGQNDYDEFPWSQFKENPWKPLDVNYQTRIIQHSQGICALWKIAKGVIAKGIRSDCLGFTLGRRCFSTGELVSWGSNLTWETRHDELGWLEFAGDSRGPDVPRIHRIDIEYHPETETGVFQIKWKGIWDESRHDALPQGHYNKNLRQYSIALNGQVQTGDIRPETRNEFLIKNGWSRLEVMNAVGQPATVLSFQKFSGSSVISGHCEKHASLPSKDELSEAFEEWSQRDSQEYIEPGTWGPKPPSGSKSNLCLDHHGAFRMEPYALACLHFDDREDYRVKVIETCERILRHEREGHWYPCLCVDGEGTTPFAGGAFAHGSVCEALLFGYLVLDEQRYLEAAQRAVGAYDLYPLEHNQNYAAFALWHLATLYGIRDEEHVLQRALYYLQFAAHHIDMSGAQRGHNYYSAYGGITLKGLAKLLAVFPEDHPSYLWLKDKTLRYTNQMLARQQASGLFAERNRKYLGYHTLTPVAGLVEVSIALGGEVAKRLRPALSAAWQAQQKKPEGLGIASMARLL